jgi:hypothetical protein
MKKYHDKNKRAIAEIISYVLLIVIAMSIAVGVYAWLKIYVPSEKEADVCQENTAINIDDYTCYTNTQVISLTLKNRGYFNIEGFFIKAANDTAKAIPSYLLNVIPSGPGYSGIYQFPVNDKFIPGETINLNFTYKNISAVTKIQIQPFILGNKSKRIIPCETKIELPIQDCGTTFGPEPTVCNPAVSDSLVAWWRFEGDATDCSGQDGNVVGSVKYGPGNKAGETGLMLNGTSGSYVSIPSSSELEFGTDNFTISFWVNVNELANQEVLNKFNSANGRWKINFNTTNIRFLSSIPLIPPKILNASYTPQTWTNFAFIRNGTNGTICKNANCNTISGFFSTMNFDNALELRIGCDNLGVNCLNGTIDEVMIYSKTLSSAEIAAIYNS